MQPKLHKHQSCIWLLLGLLITTACNDNNEPLDCSDCDKNPIPKDTIFIDSTLLNYCLFPVDSWWIYECSDYNGTKWYDTVLTTFSVREIIFQWLLYENAYEVVKEEFNHSSTRMDYPDRHFDWLECRPNYFYTGWLGSLLTYPLIPGFNELPHGRIIIDSIGDKAIPPFTFKGIYKVKSGDNYDVLLAKNVGVIAIDIPDLNGYKAQLIDFKIK